MYIILLILFIAFIAFIAFCYSMDLSNRDDSYKERLNKLERLLNLFNAIASEPSNLANLESLQLCRNILNIYIKMDDAINIKIFTGHINNICNEIYKLIDYYVNNLQKYISESTAVDINTINSKLAYLIRYCNYFGVDCNIYLYESYEIIATHFNIGDIVNFENISNIIEMLKQPYQENPAIDIRVSVDAIVNACKPYSPIFNELLADICAKLGDYYMHNNEIKNVSYTILPPQEDISNAIKFYALSCNLRKSISNM